MKDQWFQILKERFRFSDFREGQEEIIAALLAGRDVVGVMPTGSGKSLCYQLPAMLLDGITLVISPLIALMKDQVDNLARTTIPATFINSSLELAEQRSRLYQLRSGAFKLLYVAPERFRNQSFMETLRNCNVRLVAVDESHCISEWGHDFRPDYLRIKDVIARLGHPPVVALTATATPEVRRDIVDQLALKDPLTLVTGFDRPNLRLAVQHAENDFAKIEAILKVLGVQGQGRPGVALAADRLPAGIIYAATRKNVENIAAHLNAAGIRAGIYHAGLQPEARRKVQDGFMRGEIPIVAATNAFGMGIDKSDLRFIVHHDIPGSLEAYYQEIGRAGRDGQPATCLLLFNYADVFTQEFFIDASAPPKELVQEVYATLCNFGKDEIEITIKSLAGALSMKTNDMAVSACLKILEKAGYLERGVEGGAARIKLIGMEVGDAQLAEIPLGKEVFSYCKEKLAARPETTLGVHLPDVAEDLGVKPERVSRALTTLQREGLIHFTPPFRGRGVRMLQRVPASGININFAAIQRRREFEERKLRRMIEYGYSRQCLRKFILEYFGDRANHNYCNNCSICDSTGDRARRRALTDQEITIVRKVLSCVARMKGSYGKMRVIQVLTGSREKAIEYLKLDKLSTFGILRELTQAELREVIDALLEVRLLEVEGVEYPLLKLTEPGRACMRGDVKPELVFPLDLESKQSAEAGRAERKAARKTVPARSSSDAAYHPGLFEGLRQIRRRIASDLKLPPYIVFHDETLREVSRHLPQTLAQLSLIPGLGPKKIEQYGPRVIAEVQRFLAANPDSAPISQPPHKEVPPTPARNVDSTVEFTWSLWQQGKTLADIAMERKLAVSTITGHLVELLRQRRNVEIGRVLAPERRDLILKAAAQAGGDRLLPIKSLLPADVTFDEIRLVLAWQNAQVPAS